MLPGSPIYGCDTIGLAHSCNSSKTSGLPFCGCCPAALFTAISPSGWRIAANLLSLSAHARSCPRSVANLFRRDGLPSRAEQPNHLPLPPSIPAQESRRAARNDLTVCPLRAQLPCWKRRDKSAPPSIDFLTHRPSHRALCAIFRARPLSSCSWAQHENPRKNPRHQERRPPFRDHKIQAVTATCLRQPATFFI
jgi:hypothetical protein